MNWPAREVDGVSHPLPPVPKSSGRPVVINSSPVSPPVTGELSSPPGGPFNTENQMERDSAQQGDRCARNCDCQR